MRYYPIAICITLVSAAASAQRFNPDVAARRDIAAFAHRVVDELGTAPGISIAVVRGSKPIYVDTFGIASTSPLRRADARSLFYLASSTKPFTGLAVASLGRKGLIDLDAPIARWLPNSGLPHDIANSITLRELVSLQAAVDNGAITTRLAQTGDYTPELLQRLVSRTRWIEGSPKGTFRYSNAGFNLATLLIERKLGVRWQDLIQHEVLRPAGMTSTTPYPSRAAKAGKVLAAGHLAHKGPPRQTELQKTDVLMQSAGGLYTTASDLARWLSLQLEDGAIDGKRLFPRGLVASTQQPLVAVGTDFGPYHRAAYGMGWYVGSERGVPMLHAFGSFVGNWSHVSFRPKQGLGIGVLINEEAFGGEVAELISDYAYDRLEHQPDLIQRYDTRLTEAKARVAKVRTAVAEEAKRRAERRWTLTLPLNAYTGVYSNRDYGTIKVTIEQEKLSIWFGLMHAAAEPYPRRDSVRVEFVPNQGDVISFVPSQSKIAGSLTYSGMTFTRH